HFLEVFTRYIDSGFGLLSGEVAFIATTLIVIDVTLAALLQHQLLPSGIAINLCQDAALMRLTASTLNDDHLLLVLA
ncbi:hypothetical protein LAN17_25440, partial [Mycobacterium tuberculosis]|nr:hypothetical protein [Mycobacterium tuberculosis]